MRKLNKTKEKLFIIYENTDIKDLDTIELYNYYKLYKIHVSGDVKNKLISILKTGKNKKNFYDFKNFLYKEKCKKALEEEYSSMSNLNQNNLIIKNDNFDSKNKINIYFSTMEGNKKYTIAVPKDIQFIKVIHKLFNIYPELENKKVASYISQGDRVNLFNTVEENKLQENAIILMINK